MAYKESAGAGKIFVLTNLGYEKTPNNIKSERAIGKPVKGFEYSVPASWLNKGYIEEIEKSANILEHDASTRCNTEIQKAQNFYNGYQQGIEDLLRCIRTSQWRNEDV